MSEQVTWIVLGAIGLFVVGIVVRMILAARFSKGYRAWAASKRDDFAQRSDSWDREDERFRR